MILKAVKPSPKSAGSKSSKDTYQIGPQGKKPFIEEGEKARRTIQANNRKNLLSSSTHKHSFERSERMAHAPDEDSPATPTFAYDKGSTPSSNSLRVRSANVSS
jgi:hypothetical protein